MSIGKYNSECYYDPTAYAALTAVENEERAVKAYRPIVYICSPYAGDVEVNIANARRYCRFAVDAGYIPIAPHLLFPQFLNDSDRLERMLGLHCGNALMSKCAEVWVFGKTISNGMAEEIEYAKRKDYTSQCIKENASTQQSQEEYNKKYNRLAQRYEKASSRLKKVTVDRNARIQRDREIRIFIESIKQQPLIVEAWDETLWLSLLDTAKVYADGRITFLFKNGTEINVPPDSLG